jgi:predicted dehydrogenase
VTAQLLKANGCRVIGYDHDENKVALALTLGIDAFAITAESDPVKFCIEKTQGVGVDAVIITASTQSNDVISQAAQMSRKKGRIVLVGTIGLDIKRADFFEKELSFQVSCSYGPGRYDENYEQKGMDYPIGYVRWTEKRNFQAVLEAISNGRVQVKPLISEVIDLKDFESIYGDMGKSKSIASLIRYPNTDTSLSRKIQIASPEFTKSSAIVGVIGAGNFTKMMIVPIMRKLGYNLKYIASEKGLSGAVLAKKYGIQYATSDYNEILKDDAVNVVVITVRHNLHAHIVIEALRHKKHVFVEKPLALSLDDLNSIDAEYSKSGRTLTVGFNRRFSPFATKAREFVKDSGAINVIVTVNAGFVPANSWVHDPKIGGGRIVGEACHFIDLITFLAGSLVGEVAMSALGENPSQETDNATILLKYQNGSLGVINYFSNGNKAYPKERIEVYSQGRTVVIDNFRKLVSFGFASRGFSSAQNKGHHEQFKQLQSRLAAGGSELIPFAEIMNTSRAVLCAIESLKSGTWINV